MPVITIQANELFSSDSRAKSIKMKHLTYWVHLATCSTLQNLQKALLLIVSSYNLSRQGFFPKKYINVPLCVTNSSKYQYRRMAHTLQIWHFWKIFLNKYKGVRLQITDLIIDVFLTRSKMVNSEKNKKIIHELYYVFHKYTRHCRSHFQFCKSE